MLYPFSVHASYWIMSEYLHFTLWVSHVFLRRLLTQSYFCHAPSHLAGFMAKNGFSIHFPEYSVVPIHADHFPSEWDALWTVWFEREIE